MFIILLSLLFQLAVPALQTQKQNPADLCTIQGVVVKAGTGEPLRKATVEAWREDDTPGNDEPHSGAAETDVMGRFEIKGLAPGRYRLSAERNGFLKEEYGQRTPEGPGAIVTLSSGQKVPDITFQMVPAAVISGHVYDEYGEPVVYAEVGAVYYAYENGQRRLEPFGGTVTDDRGEFRIFGLYPSQYLLQAALRPKQFDNTTTKQAYVPVYYPGVPDVGRATPITVRAGEEFSGADISLQTVRAYTLRGRVIITRCGADPHPMIDLERSGSFEASSINFTPQGAFEIHNMVPGSYCLIAWLHNEGIVCTGRQALEVNDADIDGITLTISPGAEVKGRVRVEGQLGSNIGSLQIKLSRKRSGFFMDAERSWSVKPDGSFLLKGVSDGDYEIDVDHLPENYIVKSARLDGVDVLTAGVTVDTKQAPGSLEIVVSANGASVDGVIAKDQQPSPGATVAVVPDPPNRGVTRLYKSTTTDPSGHFVLQAIAPGDYKVFAWEKIAPDAFSSPEFLQPYEKLGQSVHITEGSRNSVKVDLIPAKDSNP